MILHLTVTYFLCQGCTQYFLVLIPFILCALLYNIKGFKPAKHMVFSGLYPADGSDFEALNHAIERLTCNDASVSVTKESSTALGLGFRYGAFSLDFFLLSIVRLCEGVYFYYI